jgi:hypothetical protein
MSEEPCVLADWRTLGFTEGSCDRPVATIGACSQPCDERGVTPNLDACRAGHPEGVLTHRRGSNGFEVGRSGAAYQGVCPANLPRDFVPGYTACHGLDELESALRGVDARIADDPRAQESIEQAILTGL